MPNIISHEDRATATLEIGLDTSDQMVIQDIPIQSFWEIIFLAEGANYLHSRGIIIGDLIESSTSTSATLSDLPAPRENIIMAMHGGISDILHNLV